MDLKPIETRYKGYRFRSRLEARWAVFFETLGVPWEFEAQGFDLGQDGWYLPDFWLPSWRCWVEIKAFEPERGYLVKPTALAWNFKQNVILVMGTPWPGKHYAEYLGHAPEDRFTFTEFAPCRRCDGICFLSDPDYPDLPVAVSGWGVLGPHTCGDHEKWPSQGGKTLAAYESACSARFEHGEAPR